MKFVLRTSEVKFALHFAVRRNFTHKVNLTIEDNFTCPKGKLSFSVFSVKDNTLKVLAFLETIVGNQVADIYLGGYGEFDEFAYCCCKEYKKTHPNISLIFITPYMTEDYQKNHLSCQQKRYDGILYPEIEDKPLKFAITYRNRWMVEKADYIVACVNHTWGGAYKTYKHAKKIGKVIINLGNI